MFKFVMKLFFVKSFGMSNNVKFMMLEGNIVLLIVIDD